MKKDVNWLKAQVVAEFGDDLSRATPANMREFCRRMVEELHPHEAGEPWQVDGKARNYMEALQGFYRAVLDMPPEEAVVQLWLRCFELDYATATEAMEEFYARYFGREEPGEA